MSDNKKRGGSIKYDEDDLRYDLIQPDAHADMVKVLTKYHNINQQLTTKWSVVLKSLKKHLAAFENGEDYDKESGQLHVSHIASDVHFLNAYYYLYPQGDDRRKKYLNLPKIGLDIDEVLCNWIDAWIKKFDINNVPNSWFFDRKIQKRFEIMRQNSELDDFYLNLKPKITSESLPFVPHCYITSRPVSTEVTIEWLDKNGFPARPVYTIPIDSTKVDVAKEVGVEIFVDDSWDNFVELNNNGITCYLLDAPHNRCCDVGHLRIKSLNDLPFL